MVLAIEDMDLPITATDIESYTSQDVVLSKVLEWTLRGWPVGPLGEEFLPYIRRRAELSVVRGGVLWGCRVIIPTALRSKVLQRLHEGHPGICHMKALGHSCVWWPKLDNEIKLWVEQCDKCQNSRPAPPSAVPREWEQPAGPWSRLHLDFTGPIQGAYIMIIVDAFSKWVEVIPMPTTTAEASIRVLKKLFACHGLPDIVVSDNGPQWTAAVFQAFLAS